MHIQDITWQETISIRHQVLWPDKNSSFCHVDGDETAWHAGVFMDAELVSVASVFPDGNCARLRKFATLAQYQGQGLGSALLTHMITRVRDAGCVYFWCDARASAMEFYRKFGLQTEGDVFYKGAVSYFRMGVTLA